MRGPSYYSVIVDKMDNFGFGSYLHRHKCVSYEAAKKYLDEHSDCTHIDWFDGEEWHHKVTEEMKDKEK
jgi:hypothetical protein